MHYPLLSSHHPDSFISHDLKTISSPYKLINSIIVPRPIAFITTKSENGIINAAPFSYFNAVCMEPALVSVSIERKEGQRKDTARNILGIGEFVINICSVELASAVAFTAQDFPADVSEVSLANLSVLSSQKISVPRLAHTLIQLECVYRQAIEYGENKGDLFIGEVVCVHIHKEIFNEEGRIDFEKLNPLARLSGKTYAKLTDFFDIIT